MKQPPWFALEQAHCHGDADVATCLFFKLFYCDWLNWIFHLALIGYLLCFYIKLLGYCPRLNNSLYMLELPVPLNAFFCRGLAALAMTSKSFVTPVFSVHLVVIDLTLDFTLSL